MGRFLTPGLGSISALAFLAVTRSALAQEMDLSNLPIAVLKQLQPGVTIEQVIAQALQPIRQVDGAGDGLDAGDIDLRESMTMAEQRASQAGQVLRADLDGDGSVSVAEVNRIVDLQLNQRDVILEDPASTKLRDKFTEGYLRYDTDKNGQVTFDEMRQISQGTGRRTREFQTYRSLLTLDPNGDGHLTVTEMEEIVRKAFATIDLDQNGEISRAEFRPYQQAIQTAAEIANIPPCKLPKPADGDAFIVLGMYSGETQPTLAVNGQDDVTRMSRLNIEPGEQPIHLVVTVYDPLIWKIEGAVERISRLVVIPSRQKEASPSETWAGTAVMGLPSDKITFADSGACGGYFSKPTDKNGKRMQLALTRGVGRAPDKMLGSYNAIVVSVPSGEISNPHRDRDMIITGNKTVVTGGENEITVIDGGLTLKQQEDWLAVRGGVVEVKPEDVVAPGRVEPYVVIPGQDGLRLLVENGTLQRTPQGYRILKPLPYWPAGLAGSHSVTFILPAGIPEPEGSLGHSRVIMEP